MFQIKETLISKEILETQFACNLEKCKGTCCVEGDSGAPLELSEANFLQENIDLIKPFLRSEGIKAINQDGSSQIDSDGDIVTPLVNNKECAYALISKEGMVSCGIEKANQESAIDFKKPISCHLYPIRVKRINELEALNYHQWKICHSACLFGSELGVDLIDFLKDALIRKFGLEWYNELKEVKKIITEQ